MTNDPIENVTELLRLSLGWSGYNVPPDPMRVAVRLLLEPENFDYARRLLDVPDRCPTCGHVPGWHEDDCSVWPREVEVCDGMDGPLPCMKTPGHQGPHYHRSL